MKSLLETTLNTRDLGGYRTKDGIYTNSNILIRSDEPKQPSDRDIAYLLERHITTIIDLRGKSDIEKAPSFFAGKPDFHYHNVPIEEGSHVPESRQAVPDSYMKIADAANIRQVFWHIAHAAGGVLFHCAAGKDRTGVVSAILLLLAEVGESDIVADYMLTKECNQKRFALFRQKYPDVDINIVIPSEEYIVSFLRLFQEKYSDVQNYLHTIGLSAEEIELIKGKLVKGTADTIAGQRRETSIW